MVRALLPFLAAVCLVCDALQRDRLTMGTGNSFGKLFRISTFGMCDEIELFLLKSLTFVL